MTWPATPDDWKWEAEARELRHTGLANVRGVAEKWQQSIAALLGIFATVAFVKGPDTFTGLSSKTAMWWAAGLVLAAMVAGGAALVFAALASQGMPRWMGYVGGEALKKWHQTQAKNAINELWWSRGLALAAVALILTATAVTWFTSVHEAGASPTKALVVQAGTASCGELKQGTGGALTLTIPDSVKGHASKTLLLDASVTSVAIVSACP